MYTATKRIIGGAALTITGMYLVAVLISISEGSTFELRPEAVAAIMTAVGTLGSTWVVMQVGEHLSQRVADEFQIRLDAAQSAIVDETVAAIRKLDFDRTEEIHVRVLEAVNRHTRQVLDQVRTTLAEEVREQLGQVKASGVRRGLYLAEDMSGVERGADRGIASVHVLHSGAQR